MLAPFVKNIFVLLLTRLMQSKTAKFTKGFLQFICTIFVLEKEGLKVDDVIGIFDSIQATPLFVGVLQTVIIPELKSIVAMEDWSLSTIGLTQLLTQSQKMLSDSYFALWQDIYRILILQACAPGSLAGLG